jgi:ABC-type phosphate transport system substrate-binding protein
MHFQPGRHRGGFAVNFLYEQLVKSNGRDEQIVHFEHSSALATTGGALLTWLVIGAARLLLTRKRIAWRDYIDAEISLHPDQARHIEQARRAEPTGPWVKFRVYIEKPHSNPTKAAAGETEETEVEDPSLVLLRIRNSGFVPISGEQFHPLLKFVFPGREVRGAQPIDTAGNAREKLLLLPGDDVTSPVTPQAAGPLTRLLRKIWGLVRGLFGAHDATATASRPGAKDFIRLSPEVRLNARDRITAMVVLSGKPTDEKHKILQGEGKITDGRIDREPPRSGLIPIPTRTLILTLVPVALVGAVIGQLLSPLPGPAAKAAACTGGSLTLIGSTAFSPVAQQIASAYEKGCQAARIVVPASNSGSVIGLDNLEKEGRQGKAAGLIAMSDGPAPATDRGLVGGPVAIIVYTVIVNTGVPFYNLTTTDIKDIFKGTKTNWNQLHGGPDLPIRIISREPGSGSRNTFDRYVLGLPAAAAASGCASDSGPPAVVSCVKSTGGTLQAVSAVEGAIGYAQIGDVATYPDGGVQAVALDGLDGRFGNIGRSTKSYPFWTVEYLYTYGPATGLAEAFLKHLGTPTALSALEAAGYRPCPADGRGRAGALCAEADSYRG